MSAELAKKETASPAKVKLPGHLVLAPRRRYANVLRWLGGLSILIVPLSFGPGGWVVSAAVLFLLLKGDWDQRKQSKLFRDWGAGIADVEAYLALHELERATAQLSELAASVAGHRKQQAVTIAYLGAVARMRGDFKEAQAMLSGVSDELEDVPSLRLGLYGELSLLAGLRGQLDLAKRRLAAAEDRASQVRKPMLALARAVLLARQGQWQECLEAIERDQSGVQGLLRPHDRRALALVESLALSRVSSGGYRDGHEARRSQDELVGRQLRRPGEFDYLGLRWPEMQWLQTRPR